MADLTQTAANVKSSTGATINEQYDLGETVVAGNLLYLDSSTSTLKLIDNGAASTDEIYGVALSGGASGQPCAVQTGGLINLGATLAIGKPYFASATAGKIMPVDDATSAGTVFSSFLGIATTASILKMGILNSGVEFADDIT